MLRMFWDPIGGGLDMWDVWALQLVILGALMAQVVCAGLMLALFLYARKELQMMREDLRRERQTYLTAGVVTSDAPRAFAGLMKEEGERRHEDLKGYIRLLGKELEEYKERFLTVQGLLAVISKHTAPLLKDVPDTLRSIMNHLDDIKDSFDEGVQKSMAMLETMLLSFEMEFEGQREKIPESLRRQNASVERVCVNVGMTLTSTQETMTELSTQFEALKAGVQGIELQWN